MPLETQKYFRSYVPETCVVFFKTQEAFGGLSNMASGYPLFVNRVAIRSSEALYQACRFPFLPDLQQRIIQQNSPMSAKMVTKPYRPHTRSDWEKVRIDVMRWCLRVKLIQNWDKFGALLLTTETKPIVELSYKDRFWGAIPNEQGVLIGINALGRLLMQLRHDFIYNPQLFERLSPPMVEHFLLYQYPIEDICLNATHIQLIHQTLVESQLSLF